jgi:DNA-binding MarR family transcriptional regulator
MSDPTDAVKSSVARLASSAALFVDAFAERIGLNPTDLRCLQVVVDRPGVTASELGDRSALTSGAVTGVLDRLERAGLVERVADPADRRRTHVRALPKGEAAVSGISDALASGVDAVLAPLDQRQAAAVRGFVEGLPAVLEREAMRMRAEQRGATVGEMFSVPLDGARAGRLRLASGAPRVSLRAAPLGPSAEARMVAELSHSNLVLHAIGDPGVLCRASFEGPLPEVHSRDGVVDVRYKRRLEWRDRVARVGLSAAIPWDLELSGGFSSVACELQDAWLRTFELSGGVDRLHLRLPAPRGVVGVRVSGSSADVTLQVPVGTAARLSLSGGAQLVRFVDQAMRQVHGRLRLETRDAAAAPDRYDIDLSGGVRDLTVTRG